MTKLKNKWRSITLVFLLASYMILVVFLKQPLSTFFICLGLYFLIFLGVFFGTFMGVIGVLIQVFLKKESMTLPFYRLAYKYNTHNTMILATYGLILLRQNNTTTALDCFEKGLMYNTFFQTTKTLMGNKAICYWKLGDFNQAIALYYEMMVKFGNEDQLFLKEESYTPEMIETIVNDNSYMYPQDFTTLGYLYLLKKDYIKAEFFTRVAMHMKENYAAAYDNLGQIAFEEKNIPQAKENFAKALDINKNLPDSLYFMGLVLEQEGLMVEAIDHLSKAKKCRLDGLNTITYDMIDIALARITHSKP